MAVHQAFVNAAHLHAAQRVMPFLRCIMHRLNSPDPDCVGFCRTPTATQFYCEVCGVFATSEEQLIMHNEGKKHKRTVALKELTQGHLSHHRADSAAALDASPGSSAVHMSPDMHQQHNGLGQAANEADTALLCTICQAVMPSLEHMQYHLSYVLLFLACNALLHQCQITKSDNVS